MLFIYWSIIILAPVVSKEENIFEKKEVIFPIAKTGN
tara:strand:+ start:768 stop:878 length:111 start_codon:yes stop_codon:yes gene_type:complete